MSGNRVLHTSSFSICSIVHNHKSRWSLCATNTSCNGFNLHQVWPSDTLELCYSLLVTIVQVGLYLYLYFSRHCTGQFANLQICPFSFPLDRVHPTWPWPWPSSWAIGHCDHDHDYQHHHDHHVHHLINVQFLLPLLVAGIANAAIYCKLKVVKLNMLMLSMWSHRYICVKRQNWISVFSPCKFWVNFCNWTTAEGPGWFEMHLSQMKICVFFTIGFRRNKLAKIK